MARIVIRNTPANSGAGMSIKEAFDAVNSNFAELYDTYIVERISEEIQDIESTFTGGTISNTIEIVSTVSSTGTDSGALVVDGGVGIAGNLNVGGAGSVNGNLRVVGNVTTQHVTSSSLEVSNRLTAGELDAAAISMTGNISCGNIGVSGSVDADSIYIADLGGIYRLEVDTTMSASAITATNLTADTAILTNLTAGDAVADNLTATDLTATTLNSSTITSVNLTAEAVNATNLTAGDINSATLNSVTINSTNITSDEISAPLITANTITSSGTLVFDSEVNFTGNVFTDKITANDTLTVADVTVNGLINGSTRWFNGNLIIEDGYGINGSSRVLTNFLQTGIGEATGLGTGSLRSLGGCSIDGNLYVGGGANFLSNTSISNSYVPAASTDSGTAGQISWDEDYFYVYVGTQWIRFAKDTGSW